MIYEIVTRRDSGLEWTPDGIGTNNEFATPEEAEAGIVALRALGDEWASAEYSVRFLKDAG